MAIEWGRLGRSHFHTSIWNHQPVQPVASLSSARSNLLSRRFESEIGDRGHRLFEPPRSGGHIGMVVSMLDAGGHFNSMFINFPFVWMLVSLFRSLGNHQPDLPQDSWNIHFTPVTTKSYLRSPARNTFFAGLLEVCYAAPTYLSWYLLHAFIISICCDVYWI